MIVTLTLAPAIDWTVALGAVDLGDVNRGHTVAREPSGKGVNVTIALHRHGVASLAVVPLGGPNGELFRTLAAAEGITLHPVPIAAECRQNITLREDSGRDTKVNLPGAAMTASEVATTLEVVGESLGAGDLLVIAGSLPEGVPVDVVPQLIERSHQKGARVAVDTSGAALSASLEAKPDLVKPNHGELGEVLGVSMDTLGAIANGCEALLGRGVGSVLASLGSRGAYYRDAGLELYGTVSDVVPVNSVGAGDALLSGFIAHDTDPEESLARALSWGASAVQSPTTLFQVDPQIFDRVQVTRKPDHSLTLN